MTRRRLLWEIFPITLAAVVLALAAITVYALRSFDGFFREQTRAELEAVAKLAGQMVAAEPSLADGRRIDALCKEAGRGSERRITVILPSGTVAGDSEEEPAAMKSHADREEVKAALSGKTGVATRRSQTLGRDMIYVAVPVSRGGEIVAAVRAAMPARALSDLLHALDLRVALEALAVALVAGIILLVLSRRLIRPLEEIRRGADRFRDGDLSWRVRVRGPAEVRALAETMNKMASELAARIERLRQLEEMRSEFVANVSHELKTPVTSIRGFAETLRDGAEADPKLAKQYLGIIAAQAARLSSIIEDLLQLSRIEQEMRGGSAIERARCEIRPVVEAAIGMLSAQAQEKGMRIELSCEDGLFAEMNAHLMEQAVANLVDNAIKYSDEGTAVGVKTRSEGGMVKIDVSDEGPGIPPEHRARIFERFYRIDKGRSRKLGGTGLGLAIVKHIAGLHGGSVSVESEAGKGSTFTISLPK